MRRAVTLAAMGWLLAATAPAAAQDAPAAAPAEALSIVVFNSRTCARGCKKVDEFLPRLTERWGDRIRLDIHYIEPGGGGDPQETGHSLALLQAYGQHYGDDAQSTPIAYVGTQALTGSEDILARLEGVVEAELLAGNVTYAPTEADLDARFADGGPAGLLSRIGIWGVIIAGLLDGINPCAFTTIIFLLSMMTYLGKSPRETAVIGLGFTVAVFVTYFLIGLGLLSMVKMFSVRTGIATAISYTVGIGALALAAWSLVDFVRYVRSGDTSAMTLVLPARLKKRIHSVIRHGLKTRRLLLGSLVIGFLVAVLESLCTGQIYLPTITFVAQTPGMRAYGMAYLLLYNAAFILPLVVLLVAACWGVSSQRMGKLLRRHLGLLKLLLAMLFAGLGVLVLLTA